LEEREIMAHLMGPALMGSIEWWQQTHRWGLRGTVDTVLRLLEQEEISRKKAGELLVYAEMVPGYPPMMCPPPPNAPWNKLNWA
jgi:hypothetical protein